ncbi:PREDICTED: DDB1- and CUL4-associated factor 10 isoform X1 [Papilio xuthus]|uniref:DDB1- and CUL4-associated factor 10 isoform X1 n=1 Tax=Papilio xuthus TaxID=66420 RepID=A0AAJ7EBV6_PAPXU|nr:PREDICTED: DDB1- and CUL4-associated factor 10 isoform X1 [Papilio xuthus]
MGSNYTSSFMSRNSAFSPYRLLRQEIGLPTPIGAENALSKSLYCGMKPIASWDYEKDNDVPTGGVFNLEFSPEGNLLVAACEKRSIQIFDPLTHYRIRSVNVAHSDCVNCVKFLDSRMFATCSDDATIALWDIRNLGRKICSLIGHSNWVKNIEFSVKDKLLVTSGLDGSIYTWDINSYTEYNVVHHRVFHASDLMRCRLSPDAKQMVMCTTGGLLVIIHNLNLSTLAHDLRGFKPNLYRLMQMSHQLIPIAAMYDHLFDEERRENRVELISDFPEGNDAKVVSALQIHPQGWCALSRNISHGDRSEWSCIHDIQPTDSSDKSTLDTEPRSPPSPVPSLSPAPALTSANLPVPAPLPPSPRRTPPARARRLARHMNFRMLRQRNSNSRGEGGNEREVEGEESDSESGGSARGEGDGEPAQPAAAAAAAAAANVRLGRGVPSIQNDVWEASITIKQHRMVQEMYIRGQMGRNFNMQRIMGFATGIAPPATLPRPRTTPRPISIAVSDSTTPSTSGQTPASRHGDAEEATKHYIRQNRQRLLYYVEETNEGRGFIKELCFSADGRLVCSPFGRGMHLLALNKDCSELCHCVQDFHGPAPLVEVGQSLGIHQDLVVSSKFSPRHHVLVTGCLEGKIVWYEPYSGEGLF